ncbi:unnamed protein product [Schistosoma haematobium]|nr:unnamed protein product [Schistosoma haematobium]
MPKCENNQSMETLIEINPTIMNDVEQMEQLKQSNKNVNTLTKQSSHCVNHNYQHDQHLNDNDMETNYDLSKTVNNEQKITSINNHNTNSHSELSVKSTNKKHITRNQKVTNFKQKNCSNVLPVWEFINANDNSIVNIQCMDTLTHHQIIKKNISIMTEPVDMTIQSITCSVEKSTQTIVNEFNDKYKTNYPVELNTSISTPTSLHSNVILNHENNKSLVNSLVQTDSVNHHHHHHYDYYNNLIKRNNKVNKTRKCVKSKIQNNQTRRSREYRRKRMKNRLVQEKSESFSSSSCSSSSSSSNSSISSSFLSKKNEKFDDDNNIDVDRNNKVKLTSFQIQEGNHQLVQNVKQLNVSNDIPLNNPDKTRISLPEDDEKETGFIELISKSLPHCKLIQGQRRQQRQQQQDESIIEINSDKELESIIQLMNGTFQDNHLSNSIQNKVNPYGKQYTSMYTCKHLNITMNNNNNNNNQIMKQTRTFLSKPYQQESQFIRNNQPYFKQTNEQEQYDHINTNYYYYDDDDQFYPSSNCQNEQDEQWNDTIDHDCNKSNITEVHLEKEEEQLLRDLFFISN